MEEKRILAVDDDKALLSSLVPILQSEGYLVDTASTGREAIAKIMERAYDLMLVDIELPDMEGTDLLQRLPIDSADTVKIILTGHPNMDKVVTALFRGADAYIMKPVSPDELLKIVEDKLTRRGKLGLMNNKKAANWIETRTQKI